MAVGATAPRSRHDNALGKSRRRENEGSKNDGNDGNGGNEKARTGRAFAFFAISPGEDEIGAGERSRTLDLLITNELLYQLSYTGVSAIPHYWVPRSLPF